MKFYTILTSILKYDFRDRTKIFFSIIFPILFMVIFGFVFSGSNESSIIIGYCGNANPMFDKLLKSLNYKVIHFENITNLKNALKNQKIDFGILYKNKTFTQILSKANIQNYETYKNTFNSLLENYAIKKSNAKILFKSKEVDINPKKISGLNYLIPGVLALSIMSSSMFAAIEIISHYKKSNILKRFSVTPLKAITFLYSSFISKMILSLISTYIVLATGIAIFNINFNINFISLNFNIIASSILMFSFGTIIAVIFKNPETASNIASMLFTVMMFFSGLYFPIRFLPNYLQIIAKFLPASYVAQFMRYSFGIEKLNLQYVYIVNVIIVAISVILLTLISKTLFAIKEES